MHSTAHANVITVSQSADVWQLKRGGQMLAAIERAWDDHHWFVFSADASGQMVFHGAHGRTASLKACLRMWARRNAGGVAPLFHNEQQPE